MIVMRSQKKRTATKAELRALASAGLVVTRYAPDGERATVEQLSAEKSRSGRTFARRLTGSDEATNESEASERS